MHSRDITLLIVLLWFNTVHYSSLFQYFLSMCYGVENSNFFVLTFCKIELLLVNPRIPHQMAPRPSYQLSSEKWSIHYASLSAMFNPLHSIMNQELFKNNLCNQSSLNEKVQMISITKGSHHVLPPNWHFLLSAEMNGTQRRTLVSTWVMHCTYCNMHLSGQSNIEQWKIKPVALAVIELHLFEGIS